MQIIKYKWENWRPSFLLKNGGDISRIALFDNDISFNIGKKICIGFFKDGKHYDCPHSREIETGWNCNECRINDDYFFCMTCNGTECLNEKMREDCKTNKYYLYLAAFDSLLKVGISYEFRVQERLVEQGADMAAVIAIVQDGMEVRKIEQKIREELDITDAVRGETKTKNLFGDPNNSASVICSALKKLKSNGFSARPEIYDMRQHYRLNNVIFAPEALEIKDGMKLEGRFVAAKGNIAVLNKKHKFYSLNTHRLIGREIEMC